MEKNKLLPLSIIILAISIAFGSIWIGNSIKQAADKSISINSKTNSTDSNILELDEAARYLKISEAQLLYIIQGKIDINYVKIGSKYIFSKEGLDKWVQNSKLELQP